MVWIAGQTISTPGAIVFSSIPQTFTHLQIRLTCRSDFASTVASNFIRFNSDAGSSYPTHILLGDGATVSASGVAAQTVGNLGNMPAASSTANVFASCVADVLDYSSTSKYKTLRDIHGFDANGSGQVYFASSLWLSTSAITSILLVSGGGANYVAGTRADLYGFTTSQVTGA